MGRTVPVTARAATGADGRGAPPRPPARGEDPAVRGWTALGAVVAVALVHLAPAVGLPSGALDADLGIQFHLGGETARGAVPLVDFEHTWNVASWWFNAALHRLAGGDPSVWLYLWGRAFGPALAAVTAVGILWRLRLRAEWILVGAGAWLALSHVIHAKYAIPVVWAYVLLPTGRGTSTARAIAVRAVLAGATVLAQVELAVLLGAGTILYDLVGPDRTTLLPTGRARREAILRTAAVPAGIAAGLALELIGYAAIGAEPVAVLRQLLSTPAETAEGFNWGYPLLSAASLRPKLFPASLLVAFVPAIWARATGATRLVACLHLAQALIAIRRPDPAHVDAATTLLGLLAALVVHDLLVDPRGRGPLRLRLPRTLPDAAAAAIGAAAALVAVVAAFRTESLLAAVVPTAVLALLAVAGSRRPGPVSVGALAVTGALLLGSTIGGIATSLRSGDALAGVEALAAELAAPLERCTDGADAAWVVPGPLPLYRALDIANPTPFTVFWYGFQAEHDRVRALLDDRAIPAIVQVGATWPTSFGDLPADVERTYRPCTRLDTTPIGQPVTIWTPTG